MFTLSEHAENRAAQRNLPLDAIDYIIDHAKMIRQSGSLYFYLRNRDIPAQDQRFEHIARLAGTTLVVSPDRETIITLWRNRAGGLKHIRRRGALHGRNGCRSQSSEQNS